MEGKAYYTFLLQQYADGSATPAETAELFEELSKKNNDQHWQEIIETIALKQEADPDYNPAHWEPFLRTILKKQTPVRKLWPRIAVAAAAVIIIAVSLYIFQTSKPSKHPNQIITKQDIQPPSGTRATITLSNGQTVYLDSATAGTLATEAGVNLVKNADGEIIYNTSQAGTTASLQYNTLSNPRGSKVISLVLSDGSKVWLNSESSLKYPVAFSGNERRVEVTGEAYFEVAKHATKKFYVHAGSIQTEVLGTQFNVNSYADDETTRITLIEGSVKVTHTAVIARSDSASSLRGGTTKQSPSQSPARPPQPGEGGKQYQSITLKPGQQLQADPNSPFTIHHSPDLPQVLAWKNGLFKFNQTSIVPIMNQLSRWYDVEIIYEAKPTDRFVSTIPRDVPASEVFKILEATGRVHFKIEGRKVIVMK